MTVSSYILRRSKIPDLNENELILFHDGGNFGDLYSSEHDYKRRILEKFTKNRIVMFPQTINYRLAWLRDRDRRLYEKNPNFLIVTRAFSSFLYAQKYFPKTKSIVIPDMAFILVVYLINFRKL